VRTDELDPRKAIGEESVERSLRPKNLREFIGQPKLRENLEVFLTAAQQRSEPLDHLLLYGPPGLGKTSIDPRVALALGTQIHVPRGPAIWA